jgi:molybdopterin molybdotransferase
MADELAASRDALAPAASGCDVLLTSAGVSVGEEDHLKQAIGRTRPRRLLAPGDPARQAPGVWQRGWQTVAGLPGNPSVALITALVVVRPFLLRARDGTGTPVPIPVPAGLNGKAQLSSPVPGCAPGARRGWAIARDPAPQQSSAMLTAACWADGLVIVEREQLVVGCAGGLFVFCRLQ